MDVKKKTAAADLMDEQRYSVRVLRPIVVGRTRVRPGSAILSGTAIKGLNDGDIADIKPIAD